MSQDSIDAEGFREACRHTARLAEALGLGDYGHTIGEIVDTAIDRLGDRRRGNARIVGPDNLAAPRLSDLDLVGRAEVLAAHRLCGDDEDFDSIECQCGARPPAEFAEVDFGEELWHHYHLGEALAHRIPSRAADGCKGDHSPASNPDCEMGPR